MLYSPPYYFTIICASRHVEFFKFRYIRLKLGEDTVSHLLLAKVKVAPGKGKWDSCLESATRTALPGNLALERITNRLGI